MVRIKYENTPKVMLPLNLHDGTLHHEEVVEQANGPDRRHATSQREPSCFHLSLQFSLLVNEEEGPIT